MKATDSDIPLRRRSRLVLSRSIDQATIWDISRSFIVHPLVVGPRLAEEEVEGASTTRKGGIGGRQDKLVWEWLLNRSW